MKETISFSMWQIGACVIGTLLFVCFSYYSTITHTASAQTATSTVEVRFDKKFSGTQEGFTSSEFSFRVTGAGVDETVAHGASIELPLGEYEVEEVGPSGFDPARWFVSWHAACTVSNESDDRAILTIDNPNMTPLDCQADNQYQPAVLSIVKVITGANATSTPDDFTFTVLDAGGDEVLSQAFDASGTTELDLAPGIYSVVEATSTGYTTTYENCDAIDLSRVNAKGHCRIVNTFEGDDPDDNGGGNGGDDQYRIEGIVWHDEDEDGVIDDDEERLEGWEVTITNENDTEETESTLTNGNGEYSFLVSEGEWEIEQTVKEDWHQTYPDTEAGNYVVTIPIEEDESAEDEMTLSLFSSLAFFFPSTAHAQAITTYDGFDFGNARTDDGGNGGNNGGGNGGNNDDDDDNGGSSSSGGSGGRSGSSSGGGGDTDDTPPGIVAGEQTSVIPMGAANTGYGGSADMNVIEKLWYWFISHF